MTTTPPQPRARDKYVRPVVVEKLNDLSARLSQNKLAARPASWAFGTLSRIAPKNDLYQHYHALNLDILGLNPDEVERKYRQAIEINPLSPWWHSRLISFLAIRGRMREARDAWNQAIAVLVTPERPPDISLYRDLHVEVARVLLHRVELEFGKTVLDHVPEAFRSFLPGYDDLRRRLEVLTAAQEYGAFVPPQYLRQKWWRYGPFLLDNVFEGESLHHWMIGRVEAVSKDVVALRVAEIRPEAMQDEDAQPSFSSTAVATSALVRWEGDAHVDDVRVDDFVEVGFYGRQEGEFRTRAVVHRRQEADPDEGIFPNPNRYG